MKNKIKLSTALILVTIFIFFTSCLGGGLPSEARRNSFEDNIPLWIIAGVIFLIYVIRVAISEKKDK